MGVKQHATILSIKPYRRWLFLSVSRWKGGSLLVFRGPLGGFRLFLKVKNWVKNGWVVSPFLFAQLVSSLKIRLRGILFGWSVTFALVGYYFRARNFAFPKRRRVRSTKLSRIKCVGSTGLVLPFSFFKKHQNRFKYISRKRRVRRLRSRAIWLHFGFFYDVLVLLPRVVRVYWRHRSFTLVGANFVTLMAVAAYLRFTRNLFPYKSKGFALESEAGVGGKIKLKPGKRAKHR